MIEGTTTEAPIRPKGLPRSLEYPALPVTGLLRGTAATFPERIALREGDETLTFAELLAASSRLAHALRRAGVRERDVVALHAPNGMYHPIGWFGILLAGGTVSLFSPLQPASALERQLRETNAVAAVTHPDCADALREAVGDLFNLVVTLPGSAATDSTDGPGGYTELVEGLPSEPPEVSVSPEDTALLAYTGGTTGNPKPVQLLHRNVLANLLSMACWRAGTLPEVHGAEIRLREIPETAEYPVRIGHSVGLILSPLYHQHALMNLNLMVAVGATAIIAGRFDPVRTLDLVEQYGVDYMTTAPAAYHALLGVPDIADRDLSSVRSLTSGAAPMGTAMHAALKEAFPNGIVLEGYGLTEATSTATFPPTTPEGERRIGTVGVPVFDTVIEIRDLRNPELVLPTDTDGEVWIRGPQVAAGYLGHPELTAEQFPGGWLRTGDIGRLDADGYLAITGRLKEMLIYKGYNVYPRELEELLTAIDGVKQAAVVGRPEPVVGERAVAFVVADPAAGLTGDGLRERVASQVPPYKRISEVVFVDQLPTTPTGKILKTELKERLTHA
ncbi:AMP-binding protein [Pseudonocardia sp. RS11V-5]|uniref:class I adenylate-forming enzyme family protein n=1 Tax=Pseudonocardia terrae TaxID=2905831 RepID=UPI001E65CB37|nr:AMP-binding protein [Pseudonocardia terrae]MCE3554726.1 AMP-binding protein [Pseudonocardia terrae]